MDMMTAIFAANKAKKDLMESGGVGYNDYVEVFPSTELNLEVFNGNDGTYDWESTPNVHELLEDEKYKVNWNGVNYYYATGKYVDVSMNGGRSNVYAIGNLSILDSNEADTGEPFVIAYTIASETYYVRAKDSTATMSVYVDTVVPIAPKYLPSAPHFDLREMGLPTLTVGGVQYAQTDFTELRNAMLTNSVWVTVGVDLGSGEGIPADILVTPVYVEALNVIEATNIVAFNGKPLCFFMALSDIGMEVSLLALATA